MSSNDQSNRSHKAKRTGASADRKKLRDQAKKSITGLAQQGKKQQNLKAFTFSSIVAAQRDRIRAASIQHKRHHSHLDRKDLVDNPPPRVVAVAGPPKSGKSTLIKCLVKHYTRAPTFDCVGPVTVRVNNNLRLTFIEVQNDIGSMIDTAKIADVVLLTIDGSYGFELETFEYLNMLKTHGFPKVFGVLTHMDGLKPGTFSRTKKVMKKRFQEEVADGAKLFHVSGLIHGRYPHREILNIGRYTGLAKPKPFAWRNEHPYLVIDRVEDMTHPGLIHNNPTIDRVVALYGYVRGCPIRHGHNVHLLGVGDFQSKDLQLLDDPLPLLSQHSAGTMEDREKRRTLKKQDVKIHAPFSNVGSVIHDKDAVYIKARSDRIKTSNIDDLTMLGSTTKHSEEDLAVQRLEVQRRLNRLDDHSRFVKSLMESNGVASGPKLDKLLGDQSISLFGDDDSITSKQFEELKKFRDGSTALPNEAFDEDVPRDPNAEGQHEIDETEELLGKPLKTAQDDLYSRMTIKEVVGPDGRIRKQVVFANSLPIDNNDDDDDDDDDDNNLAYLEQGQFHDNDDGYYSLDEKDLEEGQETRPKQFSKVKGQKRSMSDNYDEDDEDDDVEHEEFDFGLDEDDDEDNLGDYDLDDFPDYADSEGEEHPPGSDNDDNFPAHKGKAKPGQDESVYLGSSKHTIHPPTYDITNFIRGGVQGLYASLNDPTGGREQQSAFFTRSSQALQRTNLSLHDLVYGAKESIFDSNKESTSFGGLFESNNNIEEQSKKDEQDNGDDDDDFFVTKHKIRHTMVTRDDDGMTLRNAGRAASTQNTFAKSHQDFSAQRGDVIDKKSALNNLQRVNHHQTLNMFDTNANFDSTIVITKESVLQDWDDDDVRATLRNRFVTGDWQAAEEKFNGKEELGDNDDDEIGFDAEGGLQYPSEYDTDDESLDPEEKKERRKARREWQRKKLYGNHDESNQSWGDDAFGKGGKRGKKVQQKSGVDDTIFDHQEELFGDFEEVNGDDDIDDEAVAIRKHLEAKIKQKDSFLNELEREAKQDEAEAAAGKSDKNGKKIKLSKEVMRNHFDYFQAQHDIISDRISKSKEEMAKLSQEDRLALFGAQPGQYIRIILTSVPCEFIENFDPRYPVVLGGLLPTEQNMGYLNFRVKKHRWFHRLLKSQDPLIFSSGWRRFQSIPAFYVEDSQQNFRYLKYTPEHLHCLSTIYGPLVAPNSGVIAFKNVYMATQSIDMTNKTTSSFRVALTGTVLDVNKNVEIRKKLKLIGTPFQIFNKTAYIQGMFNSSLEVARFENAKIQTVSGIPGRIVKALTHEGKEGTFRATFNDKIVKSDIIMCKTYHVVKIYKYYNPVTSLLLPNKSGWKGMRTQKEIRADKGLAIQHTADNEYKDIIREKRKFKKLTIPVSIASALPFKSKAKLTREQSTALKTGKKEAKLRRQFGSDKDGAQEAVKRARSRSESYDNKRNKFADKRDQTSEIFVHQLKQLTTASEAAVAANRAAKKQRLIGNTAENRERIERLKANAKKRKHTELQSKKTRAAKASDRKGVGGGD